jgi:predicted TIM-barrel fold metal-dependent hydrolase
MMVGTRLPFEQLVRLGQAVQGELVIDSHIHMGVLKDYFVPQPEAERLVACMDRYGIGLACASAFAGVGSDFIYGNNLVAEAVRAYPQRFFGYTILNANYPEDLIRELERGARIGRGGVKLITAYQGLPEETERFFPVWRWARRQAQIILAREVHLISWPKSRGAIPTSLSWLGT